MSEEVILSQPKCFYLMYYVVLAHARLFEQWNQMNKAAMVNLKNNDFYFLMYAFCNILSPHKSR